MRKGGAAIRLLAVVRWVCCLPVAAATACAADPAPLEIVANQAPVGDCTLSQEPTDGRIAEGVFDLAIGDRSSYVLTPLVQNRTGDDVEVLAARVQVFQEIGGEWTRLRFECGEEGCDEWELPTCSSPDCPVVPARGTGSFEALILPRVVTGYFQGMMDAAVREGRVPPQFRLRSVVRLEGRTASREITSAPFSFELTMCLGCLVEHPPGSDLGALEGPDCCGGGARLPACYPGQDDPLDCRHCVRTLPEICNFGRLSCAF